MNNTKRFACVFVIVFLLPLVTAPAGAHPASQKNILQSNKITQYGNGIYYVGGETVGWSIDEGYHRGSSTSMAYRIVTTDVWFTPARKSMVQQGAAKWSTYGNVYESSNAIGVVYAYNGGTSSTIASFGEYTVDSSGHFTQWRIKINKDRNATAANLAHEFGHAFGLNDLYESKNNNKLMYAYSSGTATAPTAVDGKGFSVITGGHTSHAFGSDYACYVCGGIKK